MVALASERMTWNEKMDALRQIWGSGKRARLTRVASGEAPAPRAAPVRAQGQETVASSSD